MKFYYIGGVIVFLAVVSCVKADHKENLKALSQVCVQEVHSTREELDAFFKNGMKDSDATEGVKCHVKCMMEKQGHFKNGQFDEQAFLRTIQNVPAFKDHQDEIQKAAVECKNEEGTNDCDTAFKMSMCFKDKKAGLHVAGQLF